MTRIQASEKIMLNVNPCTRWKACAGELSGLLPIRKCRVSEAVKSAGVECSPRVGASSGLLRQFCGLFAAGGALQQRIDLFRCQLTGRLLMP